MNNKLTLNEGIVDIKFENMLKAFIHKIKKEGILEEFKRRRYYMKPSEKKRLRKKGIRNGRQTY